RHRADIPNVREDAARVVLEQSCQFAVSVPGARDGTFENLSFCGAEMLGGRRNISQSAIEPDVTLALLLRVVERMRVQKRPHELAAYVLQAKFKMRVLINRMVARVVSRGAYRGALFFGDLVRRNQPWSVAGAGGGDSGVIRMRERIAQRDARNRLLDRRRSLNFA